MTEKLAELCYQKVAGLMKESYWSRSIPFHHYSPSFLPRLFEYNPFSCLPTTIVDNLIIYYTRISDIEGYDWRLLLRSGRVTNFTLIGNGFRYDPTLPPLTGRARKETLSNTFLDLSSSPLNLTAIKIDRMDWRTVQSATEALDLLLSESPNLRQVESDVKFHFRALVNCFHLEDLVIKFTFDGDNRIQDFLNVNGQFRHHRFLKHLVLEEYCWNWYDMWDDTIYLDEMYSVDKVIDIAAVLENCTELISLDCDISQSLGYYHSHELHSGSLTKRYKLQRCFLKCNEHGPFSRDAIQIASVTCPDLREVSVWTNDEGISSLSNFRNLKYLKIRWRPSMMKKIEFSDDVEYFEQIRSHSETGDYTIAAKPLLEEPEFGYKLVSLHLASFTNIDFSSIGNSCPNLKELFAFYKEEKNCSKFLPTSFRQLLRLKLKRKSEYIKADTLIGILSLAVNLEALQIQPSDTFTDAVLKDILKVNTFSKLERLHIMKCNLSLNGGLTTIASTVRSLKTFTICDNLINKIKTKVIFKKYNHSVTVQLV